MKETKVREIRNSKHHLVGKYNPERRTIQIERKGDVTIIRILPDGEIEVINVLTAARHTCLTGSCAAVFLVSRTGGFSRTFAKGAAHAEK